MLLGPIARIRAKMATLMGLLFHKTVDPRTNFVKEKVFEVKDGAPILWEDHPVTRHL